MNPKVRAIEARERDALQRLEAAGINPGSKYGLTWRLHWVDGLADAEVARECGIKEVSVRAYCSRVVARLREAGVLSDDETEPEDVPAEIDWDVEEEAEDHRNDPARHLLEAVANRQPGEGHLGFAAPCSPVVSVDDARRIMTGEPVEFLEVVGPPGYGRKWRDYLRKTGS